MHEKFLCAYKAVHQCMREAQVFASRCEMTMGTDRKFWNELSKWPFTGREVTAQDVVWTYVLNLTRECPLEQNLTCALKRPESDFPKLWALMVSWHEEAQKSVFEGRAPRVDEFWKRVKMIWFRLYGEL